MKQNMAHWDRALHFAFGLFFGLLGQSIHWGFYIVAAYLIIVTVLGYSPLYTLIHMSSFRGKRKKKK